MRWVSDDGLVEVRKVSPWRASSPLVVKAPDHDEVYMAPSSKMGGRWVGQASPGDVFGIDYIVAAEDREDLIVVVLNVRPMAAATEDDPRVLERPWRCARVIEEQAT